MKKLIIATLLATAAMTSFATAGDWVDISQGDGIQWALQAGSFHRTVTNNNERIVIGIVRAIQASTNKNEVYQIYVPLTACAAKRGRLALLNLAGIVQNEFDFVESQGTVAALLAEVICKTDVVNNSKAANKAKVKSNSAV